MVAMVVQQWLGFVTRPLPRMVEAAIVLLAEAVQTLRHHVGDGCCCHPSLADWQ